MLTAVTDWEQRLESVPVPAFRHSFESLRPLCRNENVRMAALADVIQEDPGLTIRLLRMINHLNHKHLGAEVTTVEHALMMLGLAQVASITDGLPQIEDIPAGPGRDGLMRTLSRAYHAAYQAWDWARLQKDAEPDEIFAATLLHQLAEMLLWLQAPEKMVEVEELVGSSGIDPEEAQYVVLGFGLDQLGAALAKAWSLPTLVRESLLPENAQHARPLCVMLGVQLAREVERGRSGNRTRAVIGQVAEYLHWPVEAAASRAHRNAVEAARATTFYQVLPAAARLLEPIGAVPREDAAAEFCLTPRPDVFNRVVGTLSTPATELTATGIIALSLEGLHEGAGLNRVVFAMLSKDQQRLRARNIVGADNDALFNQFGIELEGDSLFSRLMRKPQAIWINDTNRDRSWPLVPEAFRHTVRTYSFFAMSVFVKGRPAGLFYADRHTSECSLDAAAYEQFKRLAVLATRAIDTLTG